MKALLRRLGFGGGTPKLYVVTSHNRPQFQQLLDEYWLPTRGEVMFRDSPEAARAAFGKARHDGTDTTCILVDWAHLHSKRSYYRFYEKMLENYPKGRTPPPGLGEPPARPSFDKPALVLHEHEAEDPARRDGAGFTLFTAEVCLPADLRAGIANELKAKPKDRVIVVGFPVAPFELPLSRKLDRNQPLDKPRLFVFETDTVEIKVF